MGHLLCLVAGIELVGKVMEGWQKHEGVQCNCCLAIMALVRGTGSVCQVPPLHLIRRLLLRFDADRATTLTMYL